jgi:glucose-1-phosphate adenylyltransferase
MDQDTLTFILAGGVGRRLFPLTRERAKPAVPFGGKYRIIDFTLTNCLHSGLRRILVLTQYKSQSLQAHLRNGWSIFNPEVGEFISPVPPQMRTGGSWYAGTADAIYQNLYLLDRALARRILILSGDHVYRMDYASMLRAHEERSADATIACMDVDLASARDFGVMAIDEHQRIVEFQEKPQEPRPMPGHADRALASMGIYLFEAGLLREALQADHARADSSHDFGKNVIPGMLAERRVFAYRFGAEGERVSPDRYWRDVGTIDSYYEANMDLLKRIPPLDLYQPEWRIRTYNAQHPPARVVAGAHHEGQVTNSILEHGAVIAGGSVHESILASEVHVGDGARVESSILFSGVRVGAGAQLRRCIVDKHVVIPDGERIGHDRELDARRFTISDGGVVVVPREFDFGDAAPG